MVIRRISRAVRLHKLDRALDRAESYAQWQEIAAEHDQLSGAEEWRAGDDTELLHSGELRRSLDTLRKMRAEGETWALSKYLQEVLFRHQGELIQPEIYQIANQGAARRNAVVPDRAMGSFLGLLLRFFPVHDGRFSPRAGLQVHVPVRTLPGRDVRLRHADHYLRP